MHISEFINGRYVADIVSPCPWGKRGDDSLTSAVMNIAPNIYHVL